MSENLKPVVDNDYVNDCIKEALGPEIKEMREHYSRLGSEIKEDVSSTMKKVERKNQDKADRGLELAKLVKCLAAGHRSQGDTVSNAKAYANEWGYKNIPDMIEKGFGVTEDSEGRIVKAMGENTLTGGGALVPDDVSNDFISILHDDSVVAQSGARRVNVPRGNLSLKKGLTGPTGYWVNESATITSSTPTVGNVNLMTNKLAGNVALSNELIYDSSQEALRFVRDEMVAMLNETADLAYIRGLGTANTPKGLLYQVDSGNAFGATQAGAAATLAEVSADLVKMIYLVMIDMKNKIGKGGFLWNTRSWYYLYQLQDGNGNFVFRDELKAGMLLGFPFKLTTQIPINLGSGTNESEGYFCDFDKIMLGYTAGMELAVSDTASYYDGSNTVSAFAKDETVVRGILRTGLEPRYAGTEIAVLNTVKWGA